MSKEKTKMIAKFTIPYYQYLNENGILSTPDAVVPKNSILQNWYKFMQLSRNLDSKFIMLQRTGRIGTYPSSHGQEAIGVGACSALLNDDIFVPYYRDMPGQLIRGVTVQEMLQYWGGSETGCNYSQAKNDFPNCIPISSQCLHAAGVALALQYKKQNNCVLTTLGDGGTSKGDFYEALNIAGVKNLPIVFIINNNQWAISVPRSEQSAAKTLAQKAIAAGITGVQIDGNDILVVHETVKRALEKARNGQGATLIEAISYRIENHTTADDASRYRQNIEVENAKKYDPIQRLYKFMLSQNIWSLEQDKSCITDCNQKINKEVTNYMQSANINLNDMFDYMYATWPKAYLDQKHEVINE